MSSVVSSGFRHEMLVANAGSGKTYTLTTRIIRLLLAGVAVDRIAALTFTRKSAGEFLDELLERLADAALKPEKLEELAQSTEQPDLTSEDCARQLEHIVEYFGRLGLGTIDSFFSRIARQFPLESGLPEEFVIADTASLANARERALAASFARGTENNEALQAMIDQCRQISRKHGERNVFGILLDQIEGLHQRILETPEGCTWGNTSRIWKDQPPFANAPELKEAVDLFEQTVGMVNPDLSEEAQTYLETNIQALRALEPGQAWSKDLQKFVEQKLSSQPKSGKLQFTRKKEGHVELTPKLEQARRELLEALYGDVIRTVLERSRELYHFVFQYEAVYSELIRDAGLISFTDITSLLAERAAEADTEEALDWRTQVAYRIDQSFDHWLLDEFQDTSRTQWAILQAFIEEVVMDDANQRSLFYVGDTKQAIYGWRGGDSELFHEIFKNYQPAIHAAKPLNQSWRSTEPVIGMVNLVFGNLGAVADALQLPEATLEKWQEGWSDHEVAPPKRGKPGYAAWRTVGKNESTEASAQHEEVLRILQEVDPIPRGLGCAVLLRQNKDVAELAAYLQSEGVVVAVEGKSNPCTDNLLGSAILTALRTAAHPADTLSASIAKGLPCAQAWGLGDIEDFRTATLQSIAENGFTGTLKDWMDRADLDAEAFLANRSEALMAAAESFDAKGHGESIDAFLLYVNSIEVQEAEANEAIRIMTVHQAKGLGFDMVIVCGLDKSSRSNATDELVLGPNKKETEWGILMPRKDIAESDPVLRDQVHRLAAEARSNELCSAYVALTRAKQALYVISDELKGNSRSTHFGRHLALVLDTDWSNGNSNWFL
ncbi:MAG: UvrD-helicase domain-containing protein [Verrucomicrobiota bacterium]